VINTYSDKCSFLTIVLILVFLLSAGSHVQAAEPLWTYSAPGNEIGGVTISSDGSAIAVGAGRIWLFSRDGTLIANESFGDQVVFTPDGRYLLSSYADTLYLFKRGNPLNRSETPLHKLWDTSSPALMGSIDISDDGDTIVASLLNDAGTYVYNTSGASIGGVERFNAVVRTSSTNIELIVGVSTGVLSSCSRSLVYCSDSEEGVVEALPKFMEISKDGTIAVLDDMQRVRSVSLGNRSLRWVKSIGGEITSLDMTPSGNGIVVGTENGNISFLNKYGNLVWNYVSNPDNRQVAGWINCVALSKEGTITAAGSQDGKIFAVNSNGEMIWSNQTKDHIHHIAMSSDGSLVVAAGDNTVYVFSATKQSTPAVRTTVDLATPDQSQSVTSPPSNSQTQGQITRVDTLQEITALPTEYSVIRTTQSPLPGITSLVGLLVAFLITISRR
jgi:WD40 repeat protein